MNGQQVNQNQEKVVDFRRENFPTTTVCLHDNDEKSYLLRCT